MTVTGILLMIALPLVLVMVMVVVVQVLLDMALEQLLPLLVVVVLGHVNADAECGKVCWSIETSSPSG